MAATKLIYSHRDFTLYPFLYLALSFASGILLSSYLEVDWQVYLLPTIIFALLAYIFIDYRVAVAFLLLAFLGLGGVYFRVSVASEPVDSIKLLYDNRQFVSGDPIEIEGKVVRETELVVGGFFVFLNSETVIYKGRNRNVSGIVRLFAQSRDQISKSEYDKLDLRYGNRIRVAVNLNREDRFLNPGSMSFKKILDQKGIHATANIESPLLVEKLGGSSFSILGYLANYRKELIGSTRQYFNFSTSGVIIASVFGNRYHLTSDTAEIFRDGGTFHILVISGLHITFIGGILLLVTRRFTRNRLLHFAITSIFLWAYSFAVGAEIPILRAALMFSVVLFSLVLYRQGTLPNALGASGLLILIWRPEDLFSHSFHLTFASLSGILGFAFPLIETLRLIGRWSPTSATPFPPNVPRPLKIFCEILYWSERKWKKTLSENLWSCRIKKSRCAKRLENRGLQKTFRWGFEGILVTITVQLFLLPLQIFYFHRISFAGVLLNLWVSIFVVLQNFVALTALTLATASAVLALPLLKLTEILNWLLLFLPRLFIENDLAVIRVPIYSGAMKPVYVLYFVPLIYLISAVNGWHPFTRVEESGVKNPSMIFRFVKPIFKLNLLIFIALFFFLVFHPYSSPEPQGRLKVDFLDVGQGDSIFITFPNGKTMLVDGGGMRKFQESVTRRQRGESVEFEPDTRTIGEMVVSEFLWEKGYSKVDYILATHSDTDHVQGLLDVAKNFKVDAAFISADGANGEDFTEFSKTLRRNNIDKIILSSGDVFDIGAVKIEVLNPIRNETSGRNSSNNSSIVLRLSYGVRKFLLTGDIESRTEKQLINRASILRADVVKVAHHGSRTSSTDEFIKATGAEYAIIPVGRRSPFGHPNKKVVSRWIKFGAKVLTTGERGTITISTDGKNLEVQTFLKEKFR